MIYAPTDDVEFETLALGAMVRNVAAYLLMSPQKEKAAADAGSRLTPAATVSDGEVVVGSERLPVTAGHIAESSALPCLFDLGSWMPRPSPESETRRELSFREDPPNNGPLGALRAVPDASGVFKSCGPDAIPAHGERVAAAVCDPPNVGPSSISLLVKSWLLSTPQELVRALSSVVFDPTAFEPLPSQAPDLNWDAPKHSSSVPHSPGDVPVTESISKNSKPVEDALTSSWSPPALATAQNIPVFAGAGYWSGARCAASKGTTTAGVLDPGAEANPPAVVTAGQLSSAIIELERKQAICDSRKQMLQTITPSSRFRKPRLAQCGVVQDGPKSEVMTRASASQHGELECRTSSGLVR